MPPPEFDPNAASSADSGIFGLPFPEASSHVICIPVPWEATTSYGGGTVDGPRAILEASRQVDLYHRQVLRPYEAGIHMRAESPEVRSWNDEARPLARNVIATGGRIEGSEVLRADLDRVNELSERLNAWVRDQVEGVLREGKLPVLVGGDHSTPFGAFEAAARHLGPFDILQFDAHCDFRQAFEGFTHSHASIMHNATSRIPQVRRIVQVGIRHFCEEELDYARGLGERCAIHFDDAMKARLFAGDTWDDICGDILAPLGERIWISFDIDGLTRAHCPHTGTPTPGGLEFAQAAHLIARLARGGRRIIGFDLNEVAPDPSGRDEWDGNVGARLLYHMAAWMLASNGRAPIIA